MQVELPSSHGELHRFHALSCGREGDGAWLGGGAEYDGAGAVEEVAGVDL